jgi:uncharacterized protein
MKLTKELFVIPNGENYILYAPLKGAVAEVNEGVVALLKNIRDGDAVSAMSRHTEAVKILKNLELLVDQEESISEDCQKIECNTLCNPKNEFMPTSVTLFPTSDCNLRCVYCFASAGETKKDMPFEIAKSAIDYIIANALQKNMTEVKLGFHGGGEPFLPKLYSLNKTIVNYAKEQCSKEKLNIEFSGGSNGVHSQEVLKWIVNNINHVQLSFDGPKEIQDSQRSNSFDKVIKTLEYFEKKNFSYGIRTTITENSVKRMQELVEFFHTYAPHAKSLHFEPLAEAGRCKDTYFRMPDLDTFFKNFISASSKAKEYNVKLYASSCGEFDKLKTVYCGAAGENFYVTPEGYVTSCIEVSKLSDPRSKTFFYGKYNFVTKSFEFNLEQLQKLRTRYCPNIPACANCFAKYSCAGDCLAKITTESGGDMFDTTKNPRCGLAQKFLLDNILTKLYSGGAKNERN